MSLKNNQTSSGHPRNKGSKGASPFETDTDTDTDTGNGGRGRRTLFAYKTDTDIDTDTDSGRGGATGAGGRHPSFLVAETELMERTRRIQEQDGERRFARVNAREHNPEASLNKQSPEGELQNNIHQHPELNTQRFDGVDPNLNPEPALNTEARTEYDNAKREQDKEKQLRLGNMPKFGTAPTPNGP